MAITGQATRCRPPEPDVRSAWQIARVVDAILLSAAERRWVRPAEV